MKRLTTAAFVVVVAISASITGSAAFVPPTTPDLPCSPRFLVHTKHSHASYDEAFIEAASELLLWETLKASANRPVLNLSDRSVSPEDIDDNETSDVSRNDWSQGQRWHTTKSALKSIGVNLQQKEDSNKDGDDTMDAILMQCPQLFRLETESVVDTAKWVMEIFGTQNVLIQEPRILSFPKEDVEYGLAFLATMMMLPDDSAAIPLCQANPSMWMAGIEGGLQERAVSAALGAASQATSQANQQIMGQAMSSVQELRRRRGGGNGGLS